MSTDPCEAVEFAKRLEDAARGREDVTLFGVDYMPLPLDYFGMPVHVGDFVAVDGHGMYRVLSVSGQHVDYWNGNGTSSCLSSRTARLAHSREELLEYSSELKRLGKAIAEALVKARETECTQ